MSEGAFSSEPVAGTTSTTPPPDSVPASGSGWGSGPEQAQAKTAAPPGASRKILILGVALIVIVVPICVGVFSFLNPTIAAGETAGGQSALGELGSDKESGDVAFADPRWIRPSWADSVVGMTAFELPAANDVVRANGRLRPTLGVTCSGGKTDVHIVTGGTALVDPQTSGHVVHLSFDGGSQQTQQWTAADDMRALFAPAPLAIADQIRRSRSLSVGFSHYMSGPVVVEFDLRGADAVIESMAEPCGWQAD